MTMSELGPYLAVLTMQLIYAGMTLMSKAVFNEGMKTSVFVFYRQLIGAMIMVPLALIFERKQAVPVKFSFKTIFKIFMLSLFGITLALNVHGIALVYTSASLAAAIVNCLPACTFFFAVLLRLEKVNIRTISGISKIVSVLLCMAGVAILAFYKGPQIRIARHLLSGYHHNYQQHKDSESHEKKWILGSFLLFLATVMWSLWIVFQAQLLKSYPSRLRFMSIQSISSAIQSFIIAIAFERDFEQWKLGWNMRLLAAVYCGVLVTGVSYYLQALVIEKRGPVFSATWNPLSFIIATIGSVFLLGEPLRLGSVLGGIVLVLSLYTILWAKRKEGVTQHNSLPIQGYNKECPDQVKTEDICTKPPQ
ncbi:putative EamA domain-containing protein [Medicago truncatula]|uniref:WAT1-related protein n=1 Tax=Medicago truncatula TaxID=3880 RepID=G7JAW4_MEDTR|nr:WAT1-related protein At5g64700 [Medicago truncatula]AES72786.2 nodulin MtN21/EamA-like transporter family protein [Medicago truncatula]RHN69878.1 putative EamA domain-containing protein [Medicago truncatula]